MNLLYKKIWNLARPYYIKGRPMDVEHIEWMMEKVEEMCKHEEIDESILMPLAILHDVGYSELSDPITVNYYNKDVRRAHMDLGAKIAEKILKTVDYSKNKSKKIINYIKIHDNWAFGEVDIYINDKILGSFKDLDYLWIYTKIGCKAIQKILKKNNLEMLDHLRNEITPIYGKKPFSTEFTKKLRETYLKDREKDLL